MLLLRRTIQRSIEDTVRLLSQILGISPEVLGDWKLDPTIPNATGNMDLSDQPFAGQGLAVGLYDGRVTAKDTGIAGSVDPNGGQMILP